MAKKKPKETFPAIGFQLLLAAIIAISLVECLLAGLGIIPPILSYSPANIFFALLRIAIAVYAGYSFAAGGMARAALRGGGLFLASSLAICALVFAAPYFATHPILGVFVMEGSLPSLLAVIVAENTLAGAAIAAIVAWLSGQNFSKSWFLSKRARQLRA
ncbi:MAG: hypothetical protein WC717_04470 [Candidatus Micrarchaeia archaeon]|jgi:hypothetical protein